MDYKDAIQAIYEELCSTLYDKDYWELPEDVQYKLYLQAQDTYVERMASLADDLLDRAKELS